MPVKAIAAMLEPRHDAMVREMWEELQQRFGLTAGFAAPHPHISFHVARSYDLAALEQNLTEMATDWAPFRVRTAGLGVFNRKMPILYIPLVRNPLLNQFHRALWSAVSGTGEEVYAYYRPERWMPHITLAANALDPTRIGEVVQWLYERNLDWAIDIDHLVVIDDDNSGDGVAMRIELTGGREE